MKAKYLYLFLLATALVFSGCSSSFLDKQPTGGSLSQSQFNEIQGTVEGQVRGLYSMLIAGGGSSHHYFGQKSIDIAGDLLSSDMAMTQDIYGWFTDAANLTCTSTGAGRNS